MKVIWFAPLFALLGSLPAATSAAVVTDPARVVGTSAIDPAGSQTIDLDGSGAGFASQATLEADADFAAIQAFTGFLTGLSAPQNYISFTQSYIPDIALSMTGIFVTTTASPSGESFNTSNLSTSDTRGIRFRVNNTTSAGSGGTSTYTIDFGGYSAGAFDSTVNAATKAGFTVSSLNTGHSLSVRFVSATGTVLSTQTATGSSTDANDGGSSIETYFGYDSANVFAQLVSEVQIDFSTTDAMANNQAYFDDLAFTLVPDPGRASATVGLAMLLGLRTPRLRMYKRRTSTRFGRKPEIAPFQPALQAALQPLRLIEQPHITVPPQRRAA